ncbi:Pheromone-regulated membrane protein 10 [Caenorhabditis elegans]|uniref:Pheromone-regulated membrane protein 10 n=1 Tax=Caenorhabditis elegans TaxID=6239 RepID=Q9GYI6_CAEEL|nr:Pheromone-regulated membrane protein 10 [Caenorhabditis elegans]CCD70234.1 Pheromone-regulated membrane protein 10 [Caenorhabditis elegans]|eukprot:NP_500603.2 Uncharacterized protein CELE_F29B9.7 [Caenorhabditis elegans]
MSSKSGVIEFPEDNKFVHTNMADYTTELLDGSESTTKSTATDEPPNQLFLSSLLFLSSAICSLFAASILVRSFPFFGSTLSLVIILVTREWNRIYGGLLSPNLKATINYSTVMRDHREYIPLYDMDWLFGGRYKPYYYGCTGPSNNPDMERTPDDPGSRSPTKERKEGEVLKKDD